MNRDAGTSRRGFTLVELIAAMVVVAVIGTIGAFTLQRAAAANTQVSTRGMLFAEASGVMDRVVRMIQSEPMRVGSNPAVPSIAGFSASSVSWDDGSSIVYTSAQQTLTLTDITAGDLAASSPVLSSCVTAFTMSAMNDAGTDLLTLLGVSSLDATQSEDIQRLSITLTLTREGQTVTLRTRVFPRCLLVKASN